MMARKRVSVSWRRAHVVRSAREACLPREESAFKFQYAHAVAEVMLSKPAAE